MNQIKYNYVYIDCAYNGTHIHRSRVRMWRLTDYCALRNVDYSLPVLF
jgi:hypothetical protein